MTRKFDLQAELHDMRVLGGVRNYLRTVIEIQRSNREWRRAQEQRDQGFEPDTTERATLRERWQEHRDLMVQRRAVRRERRLMKTSTWDALMESVGPVVDGDSQTVHEEVMEDTIAVEKRRWLERAQWIVLLFIAAGLGGLGGWYLQPQYAPQPVTCTVLVQGVGKEASVVKCEGVPE